MFIINLFQYVELFKVNEHKLINVNIIFIGFLLTLLHYLKEIKVKY